MKLSLDLIIEKLNFSTIYCNYADLTQILNIKNAIFYLGESTLILDTLYISLSNKLPEQVVFEKGAALICIGMPSEKYIKESLPVIAFSEETDLLGLSNKIHDIFKYYDTIETSLYLAAKEGKGLHYILNNAKSIFHNEISIMNANFYIIAQTSGFQSLFFDSKQEEIDKNGRMPEDIVNAFKNDNLFTKAKDCQKVFIYPSGILSFRTLCKNIFFNKEFFCRIVIAESKTFLEADSLLLEWFSEIIQQAFKQINLLQNSAKNTLVHLFSKILNNQEYNHTLFNRFMSQRDWHNNQEYLCLSILPSQKDIQNMTIIYFCEQIMQDFQETCAFILKGNIAIIINLTLRQETANDFTSKFVFFIREGNFRAGISNSFHDILKIKEYHRQAEIALELGLIDTPSGWYYPFSKYAFSYICKIVTDDMPVELLIPQSLINLQNYDVFNNTNYIDTLKAYLHNNMNAIQTAKSLYIHRATMVYRLNRISEIGKINFKDENVIFYLQLSIRLLELNKNTKS